MVPGPVPAMRVIPSGGWRRWLGRGLLFGVLWWVLSDGAAESWLLGIPAVALSTWLSLIFWPGPPLSLTALLRFLPWFARQSAAGAIDVARRALHRDMPLQPGLVRHRTALPAGGARAALANAISMLPGTLSADLDDDELVIHALDVEQDLNAMLRDLEARISAVFGVEPVRRTEPGERS